MCPLLQEIQQTWHWLLSKHHLVKFYTDSLKNFQAQKTQPSLWFQGLLLFGFFPFFFFYVVLSIMQLCKYPQQSSCVAARLQMCVMVFSLQKHSHYSPQKKSNILLSVEAESHHKQSIVMHSWRILNPSVKCNHLE